MHRLLLVCTAATLGLCTSAQARLVWGPAARIDSSALVALACPSAHLCLAADGAGDVLSSSRPWTGSWNTTAVDPGGGLTSLSCPAASMCVATDAEGRIASSPDPAGGAATWTLTPVDSGSGGEPGAILRSLACPSAALCVAVDNAGNVLTATNPTGGAGAWTAAHVDDAIDYECYHYGGSGPGCQPALVAVSCPTTSLCVAADDAGNTLTSTDPAGGAAGWAGGAAPGASTPASAAIDGLSCPVSTFCAAVDTYGGDVVTWNPGSAGPRSVAAVAPSTGLFGIWCSSAALCLASGGEHLYASGNPSGPAAGWRSVLSDPAGVTALACPSSSRCLAVDSAGELLSGTGAAAIQRLLRQGAVARGRRARIPVLLRDRGYRAALELPSGGALRVSWYVPARHRRGALIARGGASPRAAGRVPVRIRLTERGRRRLRGFAPLRVLARATFTPPGGRAVRASAAFELRP